MKVRVGQRETVAATLAATTRWRGLGTEQELREPEGKSLLADPFGSVKEETGREGPTLGRRSESTAD
jgi:hypothetical protein